MRFQCLAVAACMLFITAGQAPSQPRAIQTDRDAVIFEQLTANAWTNSAPGAFGHSEQLTLRRDGTYEWKRRTDVVERDQAGTWSFTARGKSSGVARLSASGDLPFELLDAKLRLADVRFSVGKKIAYTDKELQLSVRSLKPVPPREETKRLAATAWVKTHPFDDFRTPDRIELDATGVYRASYRDGECRHEGLWGLDCQSASRIDFVGWPSENDCDQRGGTAALPHRLLEFSGDLLLLGAPYAPADKKPANAIFFVERYTNTLRTRGEFSGDLAAGRPLKITFTHKSRSGDDYALKALEIGFQKQRISKGGSTTEGEVEWVLKKDLTGKKVTSDSPFRHTVEIIPPFAGQAWFYVRPGYANNGQEFNAYELFSVKIIK